jgi:hypothetical protein
VARLTIYDIGDAQTVGSVERKAIGWACLIPRCQGMVMLSTSQGRVVEVVDEKGQVLKIISFRHTDILTAVRIHNLGGQDF